MDLYLPFLQRQVREAIKNNLRDLGVKKGQSIIALKHEGGPVVRGFPARIVHHL